MKTLEFKVTNSGKFISFLQRFAVIEQSLLLEIKDKKLVGKTHTPEKSVVKYSSIDMEEVFDTTTDENIKIGIMNIAKLCNAMKFFSDNFTMKITYSDEGEDTIASGINMQDDSIEVALPCGSMKLFTYISNDVLDRIGTTEGAAAEFSLTKEVQAKLSQLIGLDSDDKNLRIAFKSSNGKLKAQCKSFKLAVGEVEGDDINTAIFKSHYNYIDKEDTIAYVQDEKMVFVSSESDTKIIIGEAQD